MLSCIPDRVSCLSVCVLSVRLCVDLRSCVQARGVCRVCVRVSVVSVCVRVCAVSMCVCLVCLRVC